jgi:hypothetical protein
MLSKLKTPFSKPRLICSGHLVYLPDLSADGAGERGVRVTPQITSGSVFALPSTPRPAKKLSQSDRHVVRLEKSQPLSTTKRISPLW